MLFTNYKIKKFLSLLARHRWFYWTIIPLGSLFDMELSVETKTSYDDNKQRNVFQGSGELPPSCLSATMMSGQGEAINMYYLMLFTDYKIKKFLSLLARHRWF